MARHVLHLISLRTSSLQASGKVTTLLVWEDPIDRAYTSRRPDDAVESYLAHLSQLYRGSVGDKDVMKQYVLVRVDQKLSLIHI